MCQTAIVQDLPPLQQDRAYQLWLVWGDRQRDSGGVFRVDAQGFGLVHITASRPFTTYRWHCSMVRRERSMRSSCRNNATQRRLDA